MKKKLFWGLLAVVGLVVVALVVLVVRLDALIKQGVEAAGPKVAKVDVKLDRVRLNLLGGTGELNGLKVGNPPGYKSEAAMKLGTLSLALAPASVFSDKIHVKSILIVGPEITLEGGLKENNLTKILANIQEASGPVSTNQTESTESTKKLQIDSLIVRGAKVTASLTALGGQPLTYSLPDFEMSSLGQGPEGITGAELSQRLLDKVFNKALAGLTEQGTALGQQAVDAATKRAQDALSDPAKALQDASQLLRRKP